MKIKNIKKQVIIVLLASTLGTTGADIFAVEGVVETNDLKQHIEAEAPVKNINLAEDVWIDGLYEHAVLYTGAAIKIKGYVDQQATQQEITWQITGSDGIIGWAATGNHAKITGKAPGKVWVMARAVDGSDRAREYTVNVQDYPQDTVSQSVISQHIKPILKRPFQQNEWLLQVEVNTNLSSATDQAAALEDYMRQLAGLGSLSNKGIHADDDYEYYRLGSDGRMIEVRVLKEDAAYSTLKKILSDVSVYKQEKVEEDVKVEVEHPTAPPSQGDQEQIKEDKATEGSHQSVIPSGTGSREDPMIITFEESLSSEEKQAALASYLAALKKREGFRFVRKRDTADFAAYTFSLSEPNDFFIEIRVGKEDQEAYIPLIEMLDQVEKENLMGGVHKDSVPVSTEVEVNKEVLDVTEDAVQEGAVQEGAMQEENRQEDAMQSRQDAKKTLHMSQIFLVVGGALMIKKISDNKKL